MEIKIINKKNNITAGKIRSSTFSHACYIDLNYQSNNKVILDIQKVLLKYYNLKYMSGEGGPKVSPLVHPDVEIYKSPSASLSKSKSLKNLRRK